MEFLLCSFHPKPLVYAGGDSVQTRPLPHGQAVIAVPEVITQQTSAVGKILILPHVSPTLFYFNTLKPILTDIINGLHKVKCVGDQVEESVFIFGCYCLKQSQIIRSVNSTFTRNLVR